jgi:argininosuccinate lyase
MNGLTLSDFKTLSPLFGEDVFQVFDFEASVERRSAIGGTSKKMVERQIDILRRFLEDYN